MTAAEHNKIVGIFLMAHGGLQALAMGFICVIYGVLGSAILISGQKEEEKVVGAVFIGAIVLVFLVSLVFVIPPIVGGYKLLRQRSNARIWGIVGSIVSCISFPIGTAAGVYGLWFLFGDQGKQLYAGGHPQPMLQNPPPPPNSWQ